VSENNTRITGAVRKLKKGYGFIAGDDGHDYFFHWSAMLKDTKNFRELEVQDRVAFSRVDTKDGPRAVMIRVVVTSDPVPTTQNSASV
jgi:CspA family cold shock protein